MKKINIIFLTLVFCLLFYPKSAHAAACSLPASGNYTISSTCDIAATNSINGIDECNNNELSTTNTAILTVGSNVAITTLANSTIVVGSLVMEAGAVMNLGTGAQIKIGAPIYMVDSDTDGYPDALDTLSLATASGKRRKCLAKSFTVADCNANVFSANNSCFGHNNIAITNSGTTLTDYDVLFSLDTATPIAAASMTADCGDIRIKDSDNTTSLNYWIESGCNTTDTQIWVRVPSIPNGTKTINLDYDGVTTTNGFLAWSGSFNLMYTSATCPTSWTRNTDFDTGYFPYGSSTYGTTGGSATHTHTASGSFTHGSSTTSSTNATKVASGSHTHSYTINFPAAITVYPPYVDMVLCKNSDLSIKSGLIGIFDSSVPSGWTANTNLNGYFPRLYSSYNLTPTPAGASTHSHTETSVGISNTTNTGVIDGGTANNCGGLGHSATAGTTSSDSNLPPYLTMSFASVNSDAKGIANLITITDVLPPLGWARYTSLDGKFIYGNATPGTSGGTTTHTHSRTVSLSTATTKCNSGSLSRGASHAGSFSYTTTSVADLNIPPYKTVIYAKRNSPQTTVTVN